MLFFILFIQKPVLAENQSFSINTAITFHSKDFLGLQNNIRSSNKGISEFNLYYAKDNSISQLVINYNGYNKFTLDGSYFQYKKGIATFGIGRTDRNWSFSNNTSLILSHNARPLKSIFLELKNRFGYQWLPSKANWTFEIFNGITEKSLNNSKSMLLGTRAKISPVEGLDFEFLKTSQWGGKGYGTGMTELGSALIFDTNDGSNSNINAMAGFGISYTLPSNIIPLRIYGQAIGEDEAGSLPSCFANLTGLEWSHTKTKYPITVNIEAIDTRIDESTNGNCGANTMYNNHTYDYINYGSTMGTEIDTEGTSLALYIASQISKKINVKFSTKAIVINDNNWLGHRLSSKRQSGLINSLGVSWVKNKIVFSGNIYNQDFNLDKASIK
ncbi:capsule assembly Wzi family protein, partial [Amylibacter sp.]|nr:capsule assembly Wzi family protein [Amylibacter sp.]